MKKLVLLCALVLVAGLCFAQDEDAAEARGSFFSLEISIGVPVHWTNSPIEHYFFDPNDTDPEDLAIYRDRTVTSNTAIGASLLFNFGRRMGLTLDGDIFVGTDVMGASNTSSYSNSLFGANLLFGPVIYLYNSTFLRVPLALGAHMYYWSSNVWYPNGMDFTGEEGDQIFLTDLQLGAGMYIGIQFHFNDHVYLFSRTNVSLTLYRWHKVEALSANEEVISRKHNEAAMGWGVKPALGVGVKF